MTDPLAILFGNIARVKLMRFFVFNPEDRYSVEEIARRARLVRRTARTEINLLERAKLIKKYTETRPSENPRSKMKVKIQVYSLNKDFKFLTQISNFLTTTAPLNAEIIKKHTKRLGRIDVVVMAGIFVDSPEQHVDLLIAMKQPEISKVETAIRGIESEIGMSIRFMLLETNDLQYRLGMYDKHTRDIFDYPHDVITDRIGLKNELSKPWVM